MAGLFVLDVKFNNVSMRDTFGIELASYTIQSVSSRKTRSIDIPGRDGTYKINSAYSAKQIELSAVVEASTADEVHKKIRTFFSWLSQQNEPKIIFTDNPDVFVKADLDSADSYYITRGEDNAITQLGFTLYQYDPFQYDNGIISYSFECIPGRIYNIINDGMYVPYVIYLSMIENTLMEQSAKGLGAVGSYNHNTISGIKLKVNDISQLYSGTISHGDTLEINGKDLTILKNGKNVISEWEGNIEDLICGTNVLEMSNLEGANLLLKIEFHKRWV